MITETPRLILREMTQNDFSALYDILADSENEIFAVFGITRCEWEKIKR